MPVSLNALALLDDRRKASVEIAATKGKVAAKMLSNRAGASIRTSSLALKGLGADGVFVLRGKSVHDSYRYYELPQSSSTCDSCALRSASECSEALESRTADEEFCQGTVKEVFDNG